MRSPPDFNFRHVIWDWNGTLFDDVHLCADVMNGLLLEYNLPGLSLDRYRAVFGFPVIDYYRRLGFDFEQHPFEVVGAEFIRRYEERRLEALLRPGAPGLLHALQQRGVQHSVLSAYSQSTLEELVGHFDLTQYFIKLVGLDTIYADSKMENGLRWIRELAIAPEQVLMVGDTVHDAEVAKAMGCPCVLLGDGHQHIATLADADVPVVAAFSVLKDWMMAIIAN